MGADVVQKLDGYEYEEDDMFLEGGIVLSHRYVVLPNHWVRQSTDLCVTLALVYMLLVIPFRVCFEVEATGVLLALESTLDVVFAWDLLLNFRTAVFHDNVLIQDPCGIARIYLKGWFWVDLVATFPLELLIGSLVGGNDERTRNMWRLPKLIRLVRVIRIVRLIRFFQLSRVYRKVQAKIRVNSSVFRLIKLSVLVITLSHFLACFWFMMAKLQDDSAQTWLEHEKLEDALTLQQYVASFYWAITTITTVGYGDIRARTPAEKGFVTLAVLVGVSLFSYAVGMMSYLVHRMDSDATQSRIDEVNAYMLFRKLPAPLMMDIRQHYMFSWRRHQAVMAENAILSELSTNLRLEVGQHLKDKVLRGSSIFHKTSPEFVTELILRLHPQAAAAGDWIMREGQYGDTLCIISQGVVEVCSDDRSIVYKQLAEGDFFGEIALFSITALRMASVRCITDCMLDMLHRADFQEVLDLFPEDRNRLNIINTARERIRHMAAVQRRRGNGRPDAHVEAEARAATWNRRRSNSVDLGNIYTFGQKVDSSATQSINRNSMESSREVFVMGNLVSAPSTGRSTARSEKESTSGGRGQWVSTRNVSAGPPVYGTWNQTGESPTPKTAIVRVLVSHIKTHELKRMLMLPLGCAFDTLRSLAARRLGLEERHVSRLELVYGMEQQRCPVYDTEDVSHVLPGDWLSVITDI